MSARVSNSAGLTGWISFSGRMVSNISIRLEKGPAAATIALSITGLSKLRGLTITGLLQPNLKRIKNSAPIGSICFKGLSVSLPRFRGVGSPSLSADQAWAYSCTVDAMTTVTTSIVVCITVGASSISEFSIALCTCENKVELRKIFLLVRLAICYKLSV